MLASHPNVLENKTKNFFHSINKAGIIVGLPNFWVSDVELPRLLLSSFYARIVKFITCCLLIFVIAEVGSFFTQKNLKEKQKIDQLIFSSAHPLMYAFLIGVVYYTDKIKEATFCFCVILKEMYNDPKVEQEMVKRARFFTIANVLCFTATIVSFGFDGLLQVIRSDGTFTTVITVWPDVEDQSGMANVVRVVSYIMWCILICRTAAANIFFVSTTICLSHRFKHLQTYFKNLDEIFTLEHLGQLEREDKYEKAVKYGINMHSKTLQCVNVVQEIFGLLYSTQIAMSIVALIILMLRMMASERTPMNVFATGSMSSAVLCATGIFMCNAGDITIEAALLPTAMYCSGWQNCRGKSNKRVRKLLLLAMTQGQQPVVIKAFSAMELSYQSFVSFCKLSYSVFSVLY